MAITKEYWQRTLSSNSWDQITIIEHEPGIESYFINGILQKESMMLIPFTSTVYGKEYYVLEVNGRALYGDYSVWDDMIVWAKETFGPTPEDGVWTADARWYVNNAKFWFREERDREWFILRWA